MTRILITGMHGQVGRALQTSLAPLGELTAVGRDDCDLGNAEAVRDLVRRVRPDVIVNPAAYTAVDQAESEPGRAHAVNAQAPAILAQEASRLDALLVHYSTDYVFDGHKTGAYSETDIPSPQSVYGRSKVEGEYLVREYARRHFILRTSWVFDAHGGNFLKTILRLAREKSSLKIVADQTGAPTSATLIADVTAVMLRRYLASDAANRESLHGIYHLAAAGETSWHGYARHVVASAGALGMPLSLREEDILPIPAAEYPLPAPRPTNSRLDTGKLQATFSLALPHWSVAVEQTIRHLQYGFPD